MYRPNSKPVKLWYLRGVFNEWYRRTMPEGDLICTNEEWRADNLVALSEWLRSHHGIAVFQRHHDRYYLVAAKRFWRNPFQRDKVPTLDLYDYVEIPPSAPTVIQFFIDSLEQDGYL